MIRLKDIMNDNKTFLVGIVGIALLLRIIFFFTFLSDNPCILSFDSGHYDSVAQEVAQGRGFSNPDGTAHFYRLPGYPLFLSLIYKFVGHQPTVALFFQIILASFLPLLVFLLSRMIFPAHNFAAQIAAVMTALHPGFLIFSGLVMSETLFVFFFLLFLLFLFSVLYRNKCDFLFLLMGGMLLGCVSLIRPVGPYLILLTAVIILLSEIFFPEYQSSNPRVSSNLLYRLLLATKFILSIFLGWFLLVGSWLFRNYLLTGLLLMHTFTGPHMLNHGATRIIMESNQISYEQAKKIINEALKKRMSVEDQVRYAQIQAKLASEILMKHPWLTIKLFMNNMLKTVFSLYSSELLLIDSGGKMPSYEKRSFTSMVNRFVFPSISNKFIIPFIYYEILYHLVLMASFMGFFFYVIVFRKEHLWKLLVTLLFICLFIGLSGVCGFARLRLPVEPLIIIGASIFLAVINVRFLRF